MTTGTRIVVLGASGLIGFAVAEALVQEGFSVAALARRFTRAQASVLGSAAREGAFTDDGSLERLLAELRPDLVLNCVGALQDGPRGKVSDVHGGLVARLLASLSSAPRPPLLVHVSVPGRTEDDTTEFSRSKRTAERAIMASTLPTVILRPGFVVARNAFGGSAMVRSLAALPVRLPRELGERPFAACSVDDVTRTVIFLARRWESGEHGWKETWDVLEGTPGTVGSVVEAFRSRLASRPASLRLPMAALRLGCRLGDAVAHLGWSPPTRTTALREMQRGVDGDPTSWTARTGLVATPVTEALSGIMPSVQELWFARLYAMKPAILTILSLFWVVSGSVALYPSFKEARDILAETGLSEAVASVTTVLTAVADILIGVMIANRRTAAAGLKAGLVLTVGYLAGSVLLAPWMWLDPLGSMVKTVPTSLSMLVALATLDER